MKKSRAISLALSVGLLLGQFIPLKPAFGQSASRNLNLGSHSPTIVAPQSGVITIGGSTLNVTKSTTVLTPAESVALSQVIHTGHQSLVLSALGNATGGSFNLSAAAHNGATALVIPKGVTAVDNIAQLANLSISQNLINCGTLLVLSTNSNSTSAAIAAANISNKSTGIISSILPSGGVSGFSAVSTPIHMSFSAGQNISNEGSITSSGNLNLIAGGSITNALSSGVTGTSPILQAAGNISLSSGSGVISNSGTISAQNVSLSMGVGSGNGAALTNNGIIQAGSASLPGTLNISSAAPLVINQFGSINVAPTGASGGPGGTIIINGSPSGLPAVPITINGSVLSADANGNGFNGGQIQISGASLTVSGAAPLILSANGGNYDGTQFGNGGQVTVSLTGQTSNPLILGNASGQVSVSTNGGGGSDGSNAGPPNGGNAGTINITSVSDINLATGAISLSSTAPFGTAGILELTSTSGNVNVNTALSLSGAQNYNGPAGTIAIAAPNGNVNVNAAVDASASFYSGSVYITGVNVNLNNSPVSATALVPSINGTVQSGTAGAITINASNNLTATNSPILSTTTSSVGNVLSGGQIVLTGALISLNNSAISASSTNQNYSLAQVSNGGTISLVASNSISLVNSPLSADGLGAVSANGGSIALTASGGSVSLSNSPMEANAAQTATYSSGGSVSVAANGALNISSSSVSASANNSGLAGSISLVSGSTTLDSNGLFLSATGVAGANIKVVTGSALSISNTSLQISASIQNGSLFISSGGDLSVDSSGLLLASAPSGSASGGRFSLLAGTYGVGSLDIFGSLNLNGTGSSGVGGSVTLSAPNNINLFSSQILINGATSSNAGSVKISAGGDINSSGAGLISATPLSNQENSAGASISMTAGGSLNMPFYSITATSSNEQNASSTVVLSAGNNVDLSNASISVANTSGSGGSVGIHAGNAVTLTNSNLVADGGASGGGIGVSAGGSVLLSNAFLSAISSTNGGSVTISGAAVQISSSTISVNSTSAGNGGATTILANGPLNATGLSIYANAVSGNGGSIALSTFGDLSINSSALAIYATGGNNGNGGSLTVSVGGNLSVVASAISLSPTGTNGNGAYLNLSAGTAGSGTLSMQGAVTVSGVGNGNGGTVLLSESSDTAITIDNTNSIHADAGNLGGNGGTVLIANNGSGGIVVTSTASISAAASASGGNGGSLTLSSPNGLLSIGTNLDVSGSSGNYSGGSISLEALNLVSTGATAIALSANAGSAGNGGSIVLSSSGTGVVSVGNAAGAFTLVANGGATSGDAGALSVTAGQNLTVDCNYLSASVLGQNGNGALISLTAGTSGSGILQINNGFNVAGVGNGNGGTINLIAPNILATGNSVTALIADGSGIGNGGSITLANNGAGMNIVIGNSAGNFILSANGGASAGNAGSLTVLSGQNLTIDTSYLSAAVLGTSGTGGQFNLTAGAGGPGALQITGSILADNGGTVSLSYNDPINSFTVGAALINNGVSGNISALGGTINISNSSQASTANLSILASGNISANTLNLTMGGVAGLTSNPIVIQSTGIFTGTLNTSGSSVSVNLQA